MDDRSGDIRLRGDDRTMTSVTSSGSPEESRLDENEVAKFLRSDPTFLDKHPELLRDLSISHGSGD